MSSPETYGQFIDVWGEVRKLEDRIEALEAQAHPKPPEGIEEYLAKELTSDNISLECVAGDDTWTITSIDNSQTTDETRTPSESDGEPLRDSRDETGQNVRLQADGSSGECQWCRYGDHPDGPGCPKHSTAELARLQRENEEAADLLKFAEGFVPGSFKTEKKRIRRYLGGT